MIFYAGDVHGRQRHIESIDQQAASLGVSTIVQVGDFGIFWPGEECPVEKYFEKRPTDAGLPTWIFAPGNHENWDILDHEEERAGKPGVPIEILPGLFYAPRGSTATIEGKRHLFFGGATSTDRVYRAEGVSWWSRERPDPQEFNHFFDVFDGQRPDVVVTHEAPTRVPLFRIARDRDPVACGLESVLSLSSHRPTSWFFGHHHLKDTWDLDGTTFYCCGLHGQFWNSSDCR